VRLIDPPTEVVASEADNRDFERSDLSLIHLRTNTPWP
jgi:hypothetical protein